jgi:hypothetical protein
MTTDQAVLMIRPEETAREAESRIVVQDWKVEGPDKKSEGALY